MKYLPLIFAALRRKPVRAAATFLSVIVAFTLFGLMIGLDSTLETMAARAHADRLWTNPRFDTNGMPITIARRIASLPGVKKAAVSSYLNGYVGDPKNRFGVAFVDDAYGEVYPDQIPAAQADLIRHDKSAVIMNRAQADLLHKKVGDTFVIIAAKIARADGTKNWPFKIAGIYEDIPQFPWPQIYGNYEYFDKARPLSEQGKIDEVDMVTADPARAAAMAERIDAIFANSANPTRSMTEKAAFSVNGNGGGIDIEALTRKIALIGLFMMLLLTVNVMAQSVRERSAEFATLKTFGFKDAGLAGLVMAEAAIPCLAGAGLGVSLAGWLAPKLPDLMPPGYGIPSPTMSPVVFLWALLAALILAMASTALPLVRLSRLDVAAVLSGQA